jgi:DNA adenine methylase
MPKRPLYALPGYIGSKAKLLDFILPQLPYHGRYIEVFGGSGAVLLARQSEPLEVYNDKNTILTDFFEVLQNHIQEFMQRLDTTIHSREEFEWCRDTWHSCANLVERVARWYYAYYYSYNGMGTTWHRMTHDNAAHIGKLFNRLPELLTVHHRIKNTIIENTNWQDILTKYDDTRSVFYIDPPYYQGDKGYYLYTMCKEEHAQLLNKIFTLKGHVVLSGYPNDLYDNGTWLWTKSITCLHTTKASSIIKTANKQRIEVLWIKEAR